MQGFQVINPLRYLQYMTFAFISSTSTELLIINFALFLVFALIVSENDSFNLLIQLPPKF